MRKTLLSLAALAAVLLCGAARAQPAPPGDHHQHVFSDEVIALIGPGSGLTSVLDQNWLIPASHLNITCKHIRATKQYLLHYSWLTVTTFLSTSGEGSPVQCAIALEPGDKNALRFLLSHH